MQIEAEFRRIVSINLKQTFFCRLDEYVPRFLRLYRKRQDSIKELQPILECLDDDVSTCAITEGLLLRKYRSASFSGLNAFFFFYRTQINRREQLSFLPCPFS